LYIQAKYRTYRTSRYASDWGGFAIHLDANSMLEAVPAVQVGRRPGYFSAVPAKGLEAYLANREKAQGLKPS
jgi:hypothetical protein